MSINIQAKKNIIKKVITNKDYRGEVLVILDEIFLNFCVSFLKEIAIAKMKLLDPEGRGIKDPKTIALYETVYTRLPAP